MAPIRIKITRNLICCHQPGVEESGLDLTSYEGLMKGTKYSKMVIPGNPEGSNLMWLLDWRASPEFRMRTARRSSPPANRDAICACIRVHRMR